MPGHDEVSRAIRSDPPPELVAGGVGVDSKFRSERGAGARIALTEDVVWRRFLSGGPDDDEVSRPVASDSSRILLSRRVRVHAELRPERGAGARVAPPENTVAVPVDAGPDDYQAS